AGRGLDAHLFHLLLHARLHLLRLFHHLLDVHFLTEGLSPLGLPYSVARGHPLRGPLRSAGPFAPLVRAVPLKVTSLLSTARLSPPALPSSVARGHPLRGPLRSAGSFAPLVRAVPLKVTSLLSTERLSPLGLPCTLTHSLAASPARAVRVARSLLL